jgi:hypothetical protein
MKDFLLALFFAGFLVCSIGWLVALHDIATLKKEIASVTEDAKILAEQLKPMAETNEFLLDRAEFTIKVHKDLLNICNVAALSSDAKGELERLVPHHIEWVEKQWVEKGFMEFSRSDQ